MKILTINSGSSSIKYQLFDMPSKRIIKKGFIERIGETGSKVKNHHEGIALILRNLPSVSAIGHRVVHGAEEFWKPTLIDDRVIAKIKRCSKLAPLHNPANLAGIMACRKILKHIPQVAVFDTAFHHSLPDFAYIYGLPYEYYKRFGIRKYGFHGTSHEYVAHEAAKKLNKPLNKLRLITCHLGNGCSITAVKHGKSMDTSMGFTPLEGLLMGTRCGDLDPAVVTYLQRRLNVSSEKMDEILNKKSGLIGVSGISNDMRKLFGAYKNGNKKAKLALEIFIYRIKKYIGAYAALLCGLDAIVFTAGIGENQAFIRNKVCQGLLPCLRKRPKVLVIPTNEELMIAKQTYEVIKR
ncbi:MAG: acetate kinase [Candidatus Omnitrophica bacterium]|nr:acetate kinase [Candidatus Omnitrophota bacterium]HOX54002.1 acetate kinase [Candidatus Omnitrophota bacterium]